MICIDLAGICVQKGLYVFLCVLCGKEVSLGFPWEGVKMKVSKQEVEHVARLARLRLTEEEKEKLGRQLNQILEYVEKLNELDTENMEPTTNVVPLENVLREDEVKPSLPVEEVFSNAPDRKENYFKVPRIIE